jgi:hypothetical protein
MAQALEPQQQLDIEQISFYSPQMPPKKLSHIPSLDNLNETAKQIRATISEKKYVTWKEIMFYMLSKFNCKHIGDLGRADIIACAYLWLITI